MTTSPAAEKALDYREAFSHGLALTFFGTLLAAAAPDLGLGLKPAFALAGIAAGAYGLLRLGSLPAGGAYRAVMLAAVALAAVYVVLTLAGVAGMAGGMASGRAHAAPALVERYRSAAGALTLILSASGFYVLCRRLGWPRRALAWLVTAVALGVVYLVPIIAGAFSPLYMDSLERSRAGRILYYELAGFDFHGMRLPNITGGTCMPAFLLALLVMPAVLYLANSLLTYLKVESPSPGPPGRPANSGSLPQA